MEIRDFKNGDEYKILELFQLVFKKTMTLEFWNWRFKENPYGNHLIKLCWENDELIGHYAVSAIDLNHGFKSALSMTTMTHPNHNGKGIFSRLANDLYFQLSEKNIKSVYGFPNINSHYAFVKNLGWKDICTIPTLRAPISKFKLDKETEVSFSEISLNDLIHIENNNGILRNFEYINWRYYKNPHSKYKTISIIRDGIKHYIIAKKFPSFKESGKSELDILEWSCASDIEIIQYLINGLLLSEQEDSSILYLNTWMPLKNIKHILLEKIGFSLNDPITFLGNISFDKSSNDYFNNFNFTMGDSDVY